VRLTRAVEEREHKLDRHKGEMQNLESSIAQREADLKSTKLQVDQQLAELELKRKDYQVK